ncbi:MAG: RDD family protein [Candidatus Nanoarchaeia archaeon]|nr:RDD family protein [Candidatus Nanoarchaeia archaeon]MDD5053751.1 RDD family protein [Candidatus Nanoarchaeia archaeon]
MPDLLALPAENIKVIADINSRALAYLIDVLFFFFMILMPFSSVYYEFAGLKIENLTLEESMENPQIFSLLMIGYSSCLLIFFFYFACFEYLLNGSLGKKMLGLSVASKGKKRGLSQFIVRNLSKTIFFNFLAFDCFLMLFDAQKRRVSDFISNTLVVRNRKIIKKFRAINEL